jgi:predicted metal-dependent peptidase
MTKTKTKKQLQEEFMELTGREATSDDVRKEFLNMKIAFDSVYNATQTIWWHEVIDAIWNHIEARQKCRNS